MFLKTRASWHAEYTAPILYGRSNRLHYLSELTCLILYTSTRSWYRSKSSHTHSRHSEERKNYLISHLNGNCISWSTRRARHHQWANGKKIQQTNEYRWNTRKCMKRSVSSWCAQASPLSFPSWRGRKLWVIGSKDGFWWFPSTQGMISGLVEMFSRARNNGFERIRN